MPVIGSGGNTVNVAASASKRVTAPVARVVTAGDADGPGGSFDGVHNDLDGREEPDAHPASAIGGLQDAVGAMAGDGLTYDDTAGKINATGSGGGPLLGWGLGSPERVSAFAQPVNPVVTYGTSEWDGNEIREPGQAIFDPVTELWILPYTGERNSDNFCQIGAVLSSDGGESWLEHPQNPIGPFQTWLGVYGGLVTFDDPYVAKTVDGEVWRDSSGRAHIYVEEKDGLTHQGIGLWVSGVDTLNDWTYLGQVLPPGPVDAWDATDRTSPVVIFDGERLNMLFEGRNLPEGQLGATGHATSTDEGLTWSTHHDNPVIPVGVAGSWNAASVVIDDVIRVGGGWVALVHGLADDDPATGYTVGRYWTTDEPIDWNDGSFTELVGNPYDVDTNTVMCWGNDPTQAVCIRQLSSNPGVGERLERLFITPTVGVDGSESFDPSGLQGQIDTLDGAVGALDGRVTALESAPPPDPGNPDDVRARLLAGRSAPATPVTGFDFTTEDFGGGPVGPDLTYPGYTIETTALPWDPIPTIGAGALVPAPPVAGARLLGARARARVELVDAAYTDVVAQVVLVDGTFNAVAGYAVGTADPDLAPGAPLATVPVSDEFVDLLVVLDEPISAPSGEILSVGWAAVGADPDIGDGATLHIESLDWLWSDRSSGGGSGDVVGPASSVDGRAALFDGTTGKLLKVSSAAPVLDGDSRLTDARTPTAHTHSGADIVSGTVAPERLGSGTPSASNFLRGDGSWQTAGGGSFNVNNLRNLTGTFGLPGHSFQFATTAGVRNVGQVHLFPFYVDSGGETFDAWQCRVETPQTSALCAIAAYSVSDWRTGRTATRVAGTEITGLDVSTSGTKTPTLAAPVTLAEGHYWVAILCHGSASNVQMWVSQGSINLDNQIAGGLSGLVAGIVQATGATSLAASYTVASTAVIHPPTGTAGAIPVYMRRA